MRSFIPWIGGKSLLAPKIIAQFPESFGRYIEVFGGGGSVLFSADKHAPIEVYNDANGQLVNLFRCIKYHSGELQREIKFYLTSREMFSDIKARLNCPGFTDIQRAAMFYVLVKTSFGAGSQTYGCSCKNISTDNFDDIAGRLKRVNIEHKDFEALIKQYDRPDALFYCDPPYHTTEDCYEAVFTDTDHYRLNAVLRALKGRFILSYNDDDFVRELYKDFNIVAVERQNNLSSGRFKEVIIKITDDIFFRVQITDYVICGLTKVPLEAFMITIYLPKLLSERHMTQADLARLTGIRPSTICDLCNNNAGFIKLQHLDLICQKLGCNVDDIISFK